MGTSIINSGPRTSDGKPIFLPNLFPGNVLLYICGIGDTTTDLGVGDEFKLQATASQTVTQDFHFRDWVYLAGGGIFYEAANSDMISMKLWAPASTVTASSGGNTGNCNKVALGGGKNLIVPAAGNGAYNLVSGTPVPSYDEENGETPSGYWDWDEPDTGTGTLTPNNGAGKWNLVDYDVDLAYFVRGLQLVGNGADGSFDITVPAIKPKKILPQWKFTVTLVAGISLHTVKISWYLVTARRKTA